MAKSKLSAEQFEEELNRQTTDLNAKRHELDDIRTMADLYQKTIEEKDKDLIVKDARLKSAKEKNEAELWQLNMELSALQERLQHSLNFHQTEVFSLSNAKQRYLDLYHENVRLKKSIEELESLYEKEIHGHASQMHSLNRERKDLRKNMEDKLRKDLAGLEIAFQQQAFDALLDAQKLAMFENAKLKDEVAMQGVGITNLTGRLAKQRKACDKCRQYLKKYKQKADRLREQLAIVTSRKNDIAKRKKELADEEARLTEQSQLMYEKLSVNSSTNQLSQANATVMEYIQVNRELRGQEAMFDAWKSRFQQLQTLHMDLKPTTHDEQHGLYPEKLFPIYPLMRTFQNINEVNPWVSIDEYLRGSEFTLPGSNTLSSANLTASSGNNTHDSTVANDKVQSISNDLLNKNLLAMPDLSDDQSVSSNTSHSSFTLHSGSIHTENTSVGGQRRRLSRLKLAGDSVLTAIFKEDGLLDATTVIRGKEKRIVGLIQLACEKEKAKLRRAKRQELKEQKRKHLLNSVSGLGGSLSPVVPGTTMDSRPGTTDSAGGGLGAGGKFLEPFEGQNMVAWAVMKIVHIWAQTRPPRIPDEDLKQLNADSLNLLPKPLSTSNSATNSQSQNSNKHNNTASSSIVSFADTIGIGLEEGQDERRARREAMKQDTSIFTPQQIADHQFHRAVLEQLENDKKQGLILQEDRPLIGSGGKGLAHLEHDEFSMGSDGSSASLSHIDEEEDEDMLSENEEDDDNNGDENMLKEGEEKVDLKEKITEKKANFEKDTSITNSRHSSVLSQPTSPLPVKSLSASLSHNSSLKNLAAAELLYEEGIANDGLRSALRREAEILQLEKERMEEELLQQQHASSSSFRFLAMSADEMDAQLALDEEMDALHQQRWLSEEDQAEAEDAAQQAQDNLPLDTEATGSLNDELSRASSDLLGSFKKINLKKKRAWLHKPPLYTPNPFAVQKQQDLLTTHLKPIDTQIGGIRVHSKDAYEIGPPLLVRNESLTNQHHSTGGGLRVSLSAGQRSPSLLSPFVSPQATTTTSSYASFFDNNNSNNNLFQVEKVMSNAELRAMDPLKHRPKKSLPGVSSVRVSQKVLHQLPRAVSSPILTLQEQQELERGASTRLSSLSVTAMNRQQKPPQLRPLSHLANTTSHPTVPKKSLSKHHLASSTGALPRNR